MTEMPAPVPSMEPAKLPWYRRFWSIFALWLIVLLLFGVEFWLGAGLYALLFLLLWSGPIGNFRQGLMPTSRKAFITVAGLVLLGWNSLSLLEARPVRPQLAEDGFPVCDSSFMKRAVREALNNGPAARQGGFEASEVLDGTSYAELPVYRHLSDEFSKQVLQGKCLHTVLTNHGQRGYTSSSQWIDKAAGRYFIEVE